MTFFSEVIKLTLLVPNESTQFCCHVLRITAVGRFMYHYFTGLDFHWYGSTSCESKYPWRKQQFFFFKLGEIHFSVAFLYKKPTDTGLLLHYQSHVDEKYKRALLNTMLNRAFKLASTWKLFHLECECIKETFSRLRYPRELVESTIRRFIDVKVSEASHAQETEECAASIRIILPFKDQKSANSVRRQLADLSRKINTKISPVYTSRKIKNEIKVKEDKPALVNQQCVVYSIKCDLCDAGYVGYTCRHLHQRIEEHK